MRVFNDDPDASDPVNISKHRHIARNIIVGDTIEVCTDDYPNAAADAVRMWNQNLRDHTPPYLAAGRSIFTLASMCQDDPNGSQLESVEIDARLPARVADGMASLA